MKVLFISSKDTGEEKEMNIEKRPESEPRKIINHQPDNDTIYLKAKDPYVVKGQLWISKYEQTGIKHFKYPKAFIEYLSDLKDVYPSIDDYNQNNCIWLYDW